MKWYDTVDFWMILLLVLVPLNCILPYTQGIFFMSIMGPGGSFQGDLWAWVD